jgi:hypothetical protein
MLHKRPDSAVRDARDWANVQVRDTRPGLQFFNGERRWRADLR